MAHDHRGQDLTPFEYGIIKRKVRQIVGKAGIPARDRDDLEQDFRLHLWKRLLAYTPQRGHRKAFATAVVERYVCNVLRDRSAAKRNPTRVCSLNSQLGPSDERPVELADLIASDATNARLGHYVRPRTEANQLVDDVVETISALSAQQQDLATRLQVSNVSEVAAELGVPRTSLYSDIGRLRQKFEDAALRDYLRNRPTALRPNG